MAPDNSKTTAPKPVETKKLTGKAEKVSGKPAVASGTNIPAKNTVQTKSHMATATAQTTKTPDVRAPAPVGAISPKPLMKSRSEKLSKSDESLGADGSKVSVRGKSFRRIRGFLKGRSKKSVVVPSTTPAGESKETVSSQRANLLAVAPGAKGDDGSVYNVTLDERSVAPPGIGDASAVVRSDDKFWLRLVILLMDVNTRRFELLQLEFDSEKAVVGDVLTQVPVSVTEEKLRTQKYSGLLAPDGKEMKRDKLLTDFCTGNDVLVAVPEGVDPKESFRLAKPIVSDRKVVDVLKGSGLETAKWVNNSQEPVESIAEQKVEETGEVEEPEVSTRDVPDFSNHKKAEKFSSSGSFLFGAILFAVGLSVATLVHRYISTPIKPGQIVFPGIVLSKCGLDFWSGCEPAYLNVQPGLVSYYAGEKKAAWVIHGHSCPKQKVKDKTCVDGLMFKSDRTLWLGGEPIESLENRTHEDGNKVESAYLVPWPFAEEPKIKTWYISSGRAASISSYIAEEAKKAASKVKNTEIKAAVK